MHASFELAVFASEVNHEIVVGRLRMKRLFLAIALYRGDVILHTLSPVIQISPTRQRPENTAADIITGRIYADFFRNRHFSAFLQYDI